MTGFKFEEALRLLVSYLPEEKMKKPTLFHSVRVGTYLWNHGYSEDIQIAGLLHDALEDTSIPEDIISEYFGLDVLQIVQANSKNKALPEEEVLEDIVRRCAEYGKDAMIVKMVDVYDNYLFYQKQGNTSEIERCKTLVKLIHNYKQESWDDEVLHEIGEK